MVVLSHLGGTAIGAYAVFGFYILSGYLMTFIMHEDYGYTVFGVKKYALNRVLRIYPVYWAAMFISVLLIFYCGACSRVYCNAMYLPKDAFAWIRNLFLILNPMRKPRFIPPAWSLSVELFFYICIGLGLSRSRKLAVAWFAPSVMYHLIINILGMGYDYKYYFIPAASLPFSAGAVIYFFKKEIKTVEAMVFRFAKAEKGAPFIVFFMVLYNFLIAGLTSRVHGFFFYTNFILQFLVVASLVDRTGLPAISRALDKKLGELSYPVYLIHWPAGLAMIMFFRRMGISLHRGLLFFPLSVPFILLAAWMLTRGIERPIEGLRQAVKKLRRAEAGEADAAANAETCK